VEGGYQGAKLCSRFTARGCPGLGSRFGDQEQGSGYRLGGVGFRSFCSVIRVQELKKRVEDFFVCISGFSGTRSRNLKEQAWELGFGVQDSVGVWVCG